jgi:predicted NBD/HSP70 family sugar kinase
MPGSLTGKPQLNRVVNRRLILDRIRRDGRLSRAELAKLTAIRPPTVSAVIKELIDEGLVEEVGNGVTRGGRAPRMVALARKQPRALGFEMSETSLLAGLCDLSGALCFERSVSFNPMGPDLAIARLHALGGELLKNAHITWKDLQGVGVALPGHLNVANGHVRWSRPFGWKDVPFKALCERCWNVTTDVVNDSLAGGMAAHLFGAAQSIDNLVFLYLRFMDASHGVVGLGTGIIVNGEPYHGEFGAAGEITSPVAHPMVHANNHFGGAYANVADFLAAFRSSAAPAVKALHHVGDELATLVLHIINLLEPGMLIVGSDAPLLRDALLDRVRSTLEVHQLAYEAGKTQVLASTLGDYGVVRGAIVPTLQRVFRMPRWS